MHIKKNKMPRLWPIPRKGLKEKFVAIPSHATSKGISLLFILRNILKIAKTRKEARYITLNGMLTVNNKVRKEVDFPVQLFDTIGLKKAKLNYRLIILNRKFNLEEISEKEAETKITKVTGKRTLGKNKVQMNLSDGQNIITSEKFSLGDSIIFNTKTNKIEKVLPLKKGASIEIISGKHAGEKGELLGFEKLSRGKNNLVKLGDREVSLPQKTIFVIK